MDPLRHAYEEAARTWSPIVISPTRFEELIAARVDGAPLETVVDRLRTSDLYLVGALLDGDELAVRRFDSELRRRITPALHKLDVTDDVRDEVLGRLSQRVLLPRPDARPRIASYDGHGSLWGWVRVVAVREALALARRQGTLAPRSDEAIVDELSDDPELGLLKDTYRAAFAEAFSAAVGELERDKRTALRLHHVEGLTLERTADLLGVHRATAARWLSAARRRILEATRTHLVTTLRLEPERVDSILKLIESRFDVSVSRLLAQEPPA